MNYKHNLTRELLAYVAVFGEADQVLGMAVFRGSTMSPGLSFSLAVPSPPLGKFSRVKATGSSRLLTCSQDTSLAEKDFQPTQI